MSHSITLGKLLDSAETHSTDYRQKSVTLTSAYIEVLKGSFDYKIPKYASQCFETLR